MAPLRVLLLSTISALAAAASECRCGDAAFLGIPRVNLTAPEQLKPCAPYKLVDARGSGEPQGVSLMFQVAIERILANGTGAVSQSVAYPAGFDQNVTSGVQNTVDIIKYGLDDCPDQKFFLLGYSQGATVVLEALEKMEQASLAAVSGVVFVGNPYRIPGRRSNVDSQGRPDNRTAFGLFATHAMQANQSIPTYNEEFDQSGKVIDTCLENDIVCAADPDCTCQLASDHMSYGLMQPVQDLIVSHILDRM
ncbi:hypothetical protein QIS74_10931 [Colletotrichum tabaci]|uniref:Uncharacterized protein n=1 Tax=Colletotrichum tabaci TaxID=1209068 RepID=A0AAV9T1V4_9PEZI